MWFTKALRQTIVEDFGLDEVQLVSLDRFFDALQSLEEKDGRRDMELRIHRSFLRRLKVMSEQSGPMTPVDMSRVLADFRSTMIEYAEMLDGLQKV
jgi:hypothetical protein